ncbi:MAG: hypothetical protein CSA21_00575 [Deltaproteobacteria bacterium]|nr:MAG: hypothetical protein CSA21_00575 [Deltaproteobacteria bacterium]
MVLHNLSRSKSSRCPKIISDKFDDESFFYRREWKMLTDRYQRNLILGLLFTAKSIPSSFFLMGLPIILRLQGHSLSSIGLFQLASIPYLLKFLWAPALDRTSYRKNHFKSWVLATGIGLGVSLFLLGFFAPARKIQLLFVIIMAISLLSATLDIAISSLYIKLLSYKERGLGAAGKIIAVNIARIFGSGLLVMVYNHWGWGILTSIMAGITLLSLSALIFLEEPVTKREYLKSSISPWTQIRHFFDRIGMGRWMVLLACNSTSISAVFLMIRPLLVDQGYTPDTIAFLTGIFAVAVGALASMATGIEKIQQFLLRRRASLIACTVFNACAVALFVPVYFLGSPLWLVYIAITLINAAISFISVIIGTLVMDFSQSGSEGFDYSLQMTAIQGGGLVMSAISGILADVIGYGNFFIFQSILGCGLILLITTLFQGNWVPKTD